MRSQIFLYSPVPDSDSLYEAEELRGEVSNWFRLHPDQSRLRNLFAELVRKAFSGLGMKASVSDDLLEMNMRSNFETIGETWKQEALAQGRAEGITLGKAEGIALGKAEGKVKGIREGKREGKTEGKAEALVCLLVERFGALAPSLRTRIRRAKLATLERWFRRAIAAPDLTSVFRRHR